MMVVAFTTASPATPTGSRPRPLLHLRKGKPGVWFARKDEIADWAMKTRDKTPYLDRGPVGKTGLSGPSA